MNFRTATIKHLVLLLLFIPLTVTGQVKLPRLISEGMVLQRDSEVKIWGWASANENSSLLEPKVVGAKKVVNGLGRALRDHL